MNRSEARAVAEELYKLMRNDVKRLVKEAVEEETSEWLGAREAAELLGWSLGQEAPLFPASPAARLILHYIVFSLILPYSLGYSCGCRALEPTAR